MSQAPVLCQKLALVTGHEGQCQRGQTRDNAEKSKISSKTGHLPLIGYILALVAFSHPQPGIKLLKLPIWALSGVKIFALSQSLAICVEVSNWSNVSQSQGCVELNEMVQYIEVFFTTTAPET
jgi:hypothetical protein